MQQTGSAAAFAAVFCFGILPRCSNVVLSVLGTCIEKDTWSMEKACRRCRLRHAPKQEGTCLAGKECVRCRQRFRIGKGSRKKRISKGPGRRGNTDGHRKMISRRRSLNYCMHNAPYISTYSDSCIRPVYTKFIPAALYFLCDLCENTCRTVNFYTI